MDEKIKDQDVLLVSSKDDNKLKVVAGMDEGGVLKTVPPSKEHEKDFMKFNKHSNILENFISNFLRQYKDPTHFNFFMVSAENVESNVMVIDEMLKDPDKQSNKEMLDSVRVDLSEFGICEKQGYQPIAPERIDWAQFEQMGVTRDGLQKAGALDAMLNFRKSPGLIPITLKVGDATIRTDVRLSLREMPDGRIVPAIHAMQKEPQLDRPFYGNTFTEADKKTLLETGNLGRLVELQVPNVPKPIPAFITIDKLTNDLVALSADKVRIPHEIKGVKLDDEQKKALAEGKAVYLEGMTAKSGKNFNATVQINADKRGIEFQFGNQPKPVQRQEQQQTQENSSRELRIPNNLLGREVSPEEQAKLKSGQAVYMTGLLDREGKPFNAYVKPNYEKNKFDFLKWNPDKSKAKEITPDNASKTQVAVNSEGKTNEATKNVKEPLQKGQVQPTEKQEQKQQQEQAPKKSKGLKM